MADTTPPPLTHHIILLQSLHSGPTRAANSVEALPPVAHHWRPKAEVWSLTETAAHLAAADPRFLARLTRILREENPWLPYFGPDVARPEAVEPLPDWLARFRAARDQLLAFLSELTPDDWERPAVHETMGPTTLALQVQNIINHDADHLGQMRDLRQAWEHQALG